MAPVEAVVEAPVAEASAVSPEVAPEPAEPAAEAEKPAETAEEPVTEAAPAEEAAPEAAAEPQAPEPIKYADWTLPEGMSLPAEQLPALNDVFAKHGLSQEAAQEIVDRGSFILKDAQEKMAQAQQDAFAETRNGWREETRKQFGNRFNTAINDARSAVHLAFPNEKERTEAWSALAITGAGDNPYVIRAFAALGKKLRESTAPSPGVPADPKRSMRPADRRYGPQN